MFTVVISEKGGAERREAFEKAEIGVGRVQGNDLVLPKGNVSKHHARLVIREGRFIVADLQSTNGTYVNGRKISQQTTVREGDKIYIGDFVLRLENDPRAPASEESEHRGELPSSPRALLPSRPDGASQTLGSSPVSSQPPASSRAPAPASAATRSDGRVVSHYPLEKDPDSESAPELLHAALPPLPGPPRLPRTAERRSRTGATTKLGDRAGGPPALLAPGRRASFPPTPPPLDSAMAREAPAQVARRQALAALVRRVTDAIDLAPLDASPRVPPPLRATVEGVVREQVQAMWSAGRPGPGVERETLVRDALAELLELGPLGALLDDPDVSAVHVPRPEVVLVTRNGKAGLADVAFTGPEAVSRALTRLLAAEKPNAPLPRLPVGSGPAEAALHSDAFSLDEDLVWAAAPERTDDTEAMRAPVFRLTALGPPVALHWALTLTRQSRVAATLERIVESGGCSRAMATFLSACVAAKANIVAVVDGPESTSTLLSALASAAPAEEGLVWVQCGRNDSAIAPAHAVVVSVTSANASIAIRAALRLRPERVVLGLLEDQSAAPALDAMTEGARGCIAATPGANAKQGLARLAARVALGTPGGALAAARALVAESFDVAIEAWATSTRALRITRIAEVAGLDGHGGIALRDLFTGAATSGDSAEFAATGTVPRSASEFALRGVSLDPGLFRLGK